ncbi:hypothetical protein [Bacillus marasmi]|uniref:hypothetical protein n=1 Tax=Bacillus marasmi TaxID=1926279 RepID=UPI0011C8B55B|nr:hypothetical protein [Bacillus marasmi]
MKQDYNTKKIQSNYRKQQQDKDSKKNTKEIIFTALILILILLLFLLLDYDPDPNKDVIIKEVDISEVEFNDN